MGREFRGAFRATEIFLACVAAGVSAYLLFGHRFLAAVHSGRALPFFYRLAGDRTLPLGQYLAKADELVTQYAATAFISFFFYLLLALVVRRLLRSDTGVISGGQGQPRGVRVSEWVGAALVYALLTVACFYPILPHITSYLIGPPEDNMLSLWGIWSTGQAFQGQQGFFHTTRIFYPEGSSLLFSSSLYYWPFALAASGSRPPVTVYNLLVLSTFVFSGVGAFLLIRRYLDDKAAALLGGFIFAFSPSHFAHSLHHVSIATVQFVPLFVLFYLKAMGDNSKRNVAWAGGFLFLNALCCWDYLVYAFFFMFAHYCITAYRRRRLLMPAVVTSSFTIIGATLLALSPLIISMLVTASRRPNVWMGGHNRFVVEVLGFFVPHYYHLFAGAPFIVRVNGSYSGFSWESVGYLGIICTGIILASGRLLVKRAPRYVLGLLIVLVLSSGTQLHFLGRPIPSILPYTFVKYIPILSGARAPGRMMAYAYLFLAVLVAIAFSCQLRGGFLHRRRWVAGLLALGILADFWTPCREMTQVRLPPAYTAILKREQTMDFGILDLPGGGNVLSARYMMYQTLHGIPIVQGYLARKPSPSLVDSLVYDDLPAQRVQLHSAQVKYIVIHKQLLKQEAVVGKALSPERYVEEYGRFYEDGENLVLRVY